MYSKHNIIKFECLLKRIIRGAIFYSTNEHFHCKSLYAIPTFKLYNYELKILIYELWCINNSTSKSILRNTINNKKNSLKRECLLPEINIILVFEVQYWIKLEFCVESLLQGTRSEVKVRQMYIKYVTSVATSHAKFTIGLK